MADERTRQRKERQQVFAHRLMDKLEHVDPDLYAKLAAAGLARASTPLRDHHDDPPGARPPDAPPGPANPVAVIERYLERSVAQRPSLLASLGLSAIQILSSAVDGDGPGVPTPLTVVFTDLEGFSPFTESEGDEAASALIDKHHRTVGPIVRGRGGRVVKRLGDGLLITFTEPEASVLCGLELVEAQPQPLRLRAGMHSGDVVVTRDDVVGHVVNVAARVAEAANGGSVLVTAPIREAAEGLPGLAWSPLENRTFRGISDAVPVCFVRKEQQE